MTHNANTHSVYALSHIATRDMTQTHAVFMYVHIATSDMTP